jgi:hypothetical protein
VCEIGGQHEANQLPTTLLLKIIKVPLDYHDNSAGKAAIALIRYPATLSRNSSEYKGPILFNPGKFHNYLESYNCLITM